MRIVDYSRSFITFVTKGRGNNARLQVESVCALTTGGKTSEYFFFASCKSEDTFAPKNLFYKKNYDFCGIFSDQEYVLFRTRSIHHPGWRDQGLWRDRFEGVHQHIVRQEGRALSTPQEIVRASLENIPLVGRVEIESRDRACSAVLEFPIKTMNANDLEWKYQVDTGPLPFPDFSAEVQRPIERLSPAFVAYNAPHFAEFVVQERLPLGQGVEVSHYAGITELPARTQVIAAT